MTSDIHGSCLCGQIRFRFTAAFRQFHWCHCSRCRKVSGSANAANLFTRPDSIEWLSGEQHVQRFDLPTAERFAHAFCRDCGSAMPYLSRDGRALIVPAGCLDQTPELMPQDNIFWADRAAWYDAGLRSPKFDAYPEA